MSKSFTDPMRVPQRVLADGSTLPAVGVGTFGSDKYGPDEVGEAVLGALRYGYRLVDCASVYGNEAQVGAALALALKEGVPRSDLRVMSKIWNDAHDPLAAVASAMSSLDRLGLDYLDVLYVHWPFPNTHAPGAGLGSRDPAARPYCHDEFMRLWRALEGLVDRGVARALGTSNSTIPKLELLLRDARIPPVVNEMELHPCFQQGRLFQFCLDHDVQPVGFCPLGSPSRPERDRTPDDLVDVEQPVVREIAAAHDCHPVAVCLKWAVQRGQIPIPFATKEAQYQANLQAVVTDPLTRDELNAMASVERNNRLVKGQVFLWETAQSWLDLWDVDGKIA